jgi:hypothetical protein
MPNPVQVEVEDTTYHVHPLTAGQFRRLVGYMRGKDADAITGDFMLLAWSVRDADGTPIYATAEDAEGMTPEACNKLLPVCVEINGFGGEDAKKKPSEVTPPNCVFIE